MRGRVLTTAGASQIEAIAAYIHKNNPIAADRYYRAAMDLFFGYPENLTPRRASILLPSYVRELHIHRFRGYTIRLAMFKNEIYLIAAFRPGLPDDIKDAFTKPGLDELP